MGNSMPVRGRRVLLFTGLVFALVPIGSAMAATTVGQTGTPNTNNLGPAEVAQTDAAFPGTGTVTSFQTQSSTCDSLAGSFNFQVLRPLGGTRFRVIGQTGDIADPCDGQLHTYAVNIPVRAGDVIGGYFINWQGELGDTTGSIAANGTSPEPRVGQTVNLTIQTTFTTDEAATFVPGAPVGSSQNGQGQNNNDQ